MRDGVVSFEEDYGDKLTCMYKVGCNDGKKHRRHGGKLKDERNRTLLHLTAARL